MTFRNFQINHKFYFLCVNLTSKSPKVFIPSSKVKEFQRVQSVSYELCWLCPATCKTVFAEWVEAGCNLHWCTGATKHPLTWPLTLILTSSVAPFSTCTLKQHCKLRCATTSCGCMAFFWKEIYIYASPLKGVLLSRLLPLFYLFFHFDIIVLFLYSIL